MSADSIRHILLVPADEHREALLGDGPCGARAPAAWWNNDPPEAWGQRWYSGPIRRWMLDEGRAVALALALAFDSQPTGPEGLARALAVLARREGCTDTARGLWWSMRAPGEWRFGSRPGSHFPVYTAEWRDDGRTYFPGEGVPALSTPPDGLGDLWALAVVGEARGLWRAEVVRG